MEEKPKNPSAVPLKAILKGGAGRPIRSAAFDGFQVAPFMVDPRTAAPNLEEAQQSEIAQLKNRLTQANKDIEAAKAKGKSDAESARQKGYAEGFAKGIGEGENNAAAIHEAKLDVLKREVAQTFESVQERQAAYFDEMRDALVGIALELAKKLFLAEVEENPQIVTQVMAEACKYLGQEEKLRVRVNPLDSDTAEKAGDFWSAVGSAVQSVEIVPDPKVERGGCLIESEKGASVDLRVRTIFESLDGVVRKAYEEARAGRN
jgi:flagellar assembly protein FliH